MKSRAVVFIPALVLAIGMIGAGRLCAQAAGAGAAAGMFGQNPEDAYLSPTRYTNAFFGFSFEFPAAAALRPIPQPASVNRRIQLLDMVGSTASHAAISISAYPYKNKNYSDAKTILRQQLDQALFHGVEELRGISKANIGGRPFFYYKTRQGVDLHISLAAEMTGYVLDIDLASRNEEVMQSLLSAIAQGDFFPPNEAHAHSGTKAALYQGPAVSDDHLRQIRETQPAEHIDPGKVTGNFYRNAQIGMTFQFPEGWSLEPEGAIEPAAERYQRQVAGEPLLGPKERAVVKACRKTLMSAWKTKPTEDGDVPYDDFAEATLSAMPLACFPNIRFPEDPADPHAVREFIAGLTFTQPLQRDMNVARSYVANGKTFVVTQGTLAYQDRGDALSRRVSVALAMTEQRGYLLVWLFAAPHEAELRELMTSKVSFDPETAPKAAAIAIPTAMEPEPDKKPAEAPASSVAKEPATEEPPATGSVGSAETPPARPSLLRPGEDSMGNAAAHKNLPKQPN